MMPLSQIAPLLARGWQTHCANSGEVAVTFDDGPDPSTTPKLLKVLDQLEIKATMFVIGQKCRGNKELLKEVAAAGHTLACHGYSHERHWFRDASFVQGSIRQTMYMLQDCGLRMEPIFRPPFGAIDWRLHKRVTSLGVVPVLWSTHVADWKAQEPDALRQRIVSVVHDRMILLLHDGHETSGNVVQQLPYLNYEIQKRNLKPITLKAKAEKRRYGMVMSLIAAGVGAFHLTAGTAIAAALLKRSPRQHEQLPFISIVVPARNEAENLPRLFRSLARLKYEPSKVEMIIVNDDSTDNTKQLAVELGKQLPFDVRVIDAVHGPNEVLPPTKTLPLAQGIDAARGEFVLMTDGDCELHENWARDIVRHFEPGVGLVCGITLPDYESSTVRVTRFEAVDWSLLLGVCAGMCRLGSPLALIGNNYAVRRQCYIDVGTFRSIAHNRIDDIALFRAVADSDKWRIAFAVTPGACVKTLPVGGTEAIVKQRYRWMEGFDAVSMTGKMLFGFGMLTHLLWPLTLLIGNSFGLATAVAILLGDWLVIAACLTRLKKSGLFGYVIAYPAYACGYGWGLLVSLFRRPAITWKDRRLA